MPHQMFQIKEKNKKWKSHFVNIDFMLRHFDHFPLHNTSLSLPKLNVRIRSYEPNHASLTPLSPNRHRLLPSQVTLSPPSRPTPCSFDFECDSPPPSWPCTPTLTSTTALRPAALTQSPSSVLTLSPRNRPYAVPVRASPPSDRPKQSSVLPSWYPRTPLRDITVMTRVSFIVLLFFDMVVLWWINLVCECFENYAWVLFLCFGWVF